MTRLRKIFSTPNLVALITGLLLFSLAPQQPIHERFSLLARVAPALVLLLITLYARKQQIRNWIIPVPIVLLLIIMAISIAQMPEFFILKDWLAFVLLTLFAVIGISALGARPIIYGLALSSFMMISATAVYALALPSYSFEGPGVLRGAFYGSNSLALSLLLASPALCFVSLKNKKQTYALRGLLLLSTFLIIWFSTSRTSLVVFSAMLICWGLISLLNINRKLGLVATVCSISGLILIGLNWEEITSALGKSPDLSGRFPLWAAYIDAISQRPFQGYGWHLRTTPDMPLGNYIVELTNHPQINANNDLLNWWALTGIFGAFFALISVLYVVSDGIQLRSLSTIAPWIFLSGMVLLLGGLTELSSMHPDGWFILSISLVSAYEIQRNKRGFSKFIFISGLFVTGPALKNRLR